MGRISLNIDGREVTGFEGQSILDIARENGIDIPTLCHDDRVEIYGSCGLCVVEAEGNPRLLRACSTLAADGLVVSTNTKRVRENRRAALELLLSDHTGDCRPPCVLACPAQTDCQGYAGLIANGEYEEAYKLILEKIPLPASIGRVCPHPCEEACRRELVEEPISIAALKRFAGDLALARGEAHVTQAAPPTGKRIAVIGGGPGGLTAAVCLRAKGYGVTVYDAMPHMGGMLRYGIPEYRLPKSVLQEEIDAIGETGVEFCNNVKIGRDITLEYLRKTYDTVIVAVGAWSSVTLGCPGENLNGVLGGIDFLRDVAMNRPVFTGRRIAVVGGGNTAMDACRTAVRLGAEAVYNIYRRTRNEMPAEAAEITEAEEEGVVFKNLTNPIEITGGGGKVKAVRLQIMELGEPDASGRRSPVPVPGKEETLEVDTVIIAIGQKLNASGFEGLELTKRGTLSADEHTFRTNLDGVFAIGDATNKGADIAAAAIGEAQRAAGMADRYLNGETLTYEEPYLVTAEKTAADFAGREKLPRAKMPCRPAGERRNDFLEVSPGLSEEDAAKEAARCLECGCMDYFECKLLDYANRYNVRPERYAGKTHRRAREDGHPNIRRNPDKCILCGLCVRICDEVVGVGALGFVDRGFDTIVKPAFDADLRQSGCIACGQCVHVCPTGALTEVTPLRKQVPLKETFTGTVCASCSAGCGVTLASRGNLLTRALPSPEKGSLLCTKGRFGFGEIAQKERLTVPLIRGKDAFKETSFEQAVVYANKSLQSLQTQYGGDCVAVAVSGRYTNEEAFLVKEYAQKALKTDKIFSLSIPDGGPGGVLGRDIRTATLDEMENTGLVVALEPFKNREVAAMRIRRAVANGAKLLLLSPAPDGEETLLGGVAALRIDMGGGLPVLEKIVRALLDGGHGKGIEGREELLASLGGVTADEEAQMAAEMIIKAKKAVFIFEKDAAPAQIARLIPDMAVLSGHASGPRNGVIQLLPEANSQGLTDLGFGSAGDFTRAVAGGGIRGLFVFGEELDRLDLGALDFLAVQDLHMTETAKRANAVFPASSFAETDGSFTGSDGRTRLLKKAVACPAAWDTMTLIKALAAHAGLPVPYQTAGNVRRGMVETRASCV